MFVDAGRAGLLTTSASLAWVNASSKADRPEYFDLNFAGLKEHEHLAASLGGAWWNPTGHLRWDYGNEHELKEQVRLSCERGYPVEVWETERAQRLLEPHVTFASPSGLVAVFPSEAWVDGPAMVKELVAAAAKKGATTRFGDAVRRITVTDNAVKSIELASGQMHPVEAVVNAAGPAAAAVAALVDRRLPMKRQPGLAVRVKTDQDLVGRVIHPPQIAIRPDGLGSIFLLTHGVESALADAQRSPRELAEEVRQIAAGVVPRLANAAIADARIGYRPIPLDGLPAIGKATAIDGYYEAVTHSGITLGPVLARMLSGEILDGHIDPLVASFRASRLSPA